MKGKKKMEDKIKAIIKKVREMYKYLPAYANIVNKEARVSLDENENGDLEIVCVSFCDNVDRIAVCNTRIDYLPAYGKQHNLIAYESFDALLNM